jgi:hypothetical protein
MVLNHQQPHTTPAPGVDRHITNRTHQPDHDGIQRLVRSSGRSGYAIGWLYTCLHRHLTDGGKDWLSHNEVGDLAGGMGETAVKKHTKALVDAGLILREQIGSTVYAYRLPPRQHITEVTRFPQSDSQQVKSIFRVVKTAPRQAQSATNLEEEKEDISIVEDRGKSVTEPTTPDNEQTRIARRYVRDEEVIAIAAELPPKTVKYIAQKADEAKTSRGGYFAQAVRNAPVEAPRTKPKPPAKSRIPVPGRDDVAGVSISEKTVPPSGPVIAPEPTAPPPPPDTDDATRTVRTYLAQMLRSEAHLLNRAAITHDGNHWTVTGPRGLQHHRRGLRAYIAHALCVDPDAITVAVEVVA